MPIQRNRIIYSMRVMKELVARGNIPLKTMTNPCKPEFQCWIFEVDEKFQQDIDEILGDKK